MALSQFLGLDPGQKLFSAKRPKDHSHQKRVKKSSQIRRFPNKRGTEKSRYIFASPNFFLATLTITCIICFLQCDRCGVTTGFSETIELSVGML